MSKKDLRTLLLLTESGEEKQVLSFLWQTAREVREKEYGKEVFLRGLIEFTNICRNDCFYCGIRKSNHKVERYRLTKEQVLACAKKGYELSYRTFVLQGGEDAHYSMEEMADLIASIKKQFPDCAITLSFGEWSKKEYACWKEAGADRYLLRHETATKEHYEQLHPKNMSYEHRMHCLQELKELGYQVGAGFMVGSPGQSVDHLVNDLLFLKELKPQMIGIGPFIPQADTPFGDQKGGSLLMTLKCLAILRLMQPKVLLPATTALGTIAPDGRERGLLAGANVVMPNLSPVGVREKYALYDNKICTGEEAAECYGCLERRVNAVGYEIVSSRGDSLVL